MNGFDWYSAFVGFAVAWCLWAVASFWAATALRKDQSDE